MAPVYSWTGFYIGGDIGALWTRANARRDPLPDVLFFGTFPNTGDLKDTAFVGGVHAGYNWQLSPSWVVGIEADWSWTNAKGSFSQPWVSIRMLLGVRPGTVASMSMGPDWLATVRGRIGYLVMPTALVYFTGGAAWADVDYSASATNEPAQPMLHRHRFQRQRADMCWVAASNGRFGIIGRSEPSTCIIA